MIIRSILNIVNSSFLLFALINKGEIRIINAYILFGINLFIELWNISLYYNLKIYGRFNDVIIIELYVFLLECLIIIIIIFISQLYKLNQTRNTDHILFDQKEVLINNPII
jgi:hypothetical protein